MTDYRELNRANWDERAPAHAASPGYQVQRLLDQPQGLSDVVRFDLPRLGDVRGRRGIHPQCYIGTDTLSLARLGAVMTGLDFSTASLAEARRISDRAGAGIRYLEADVYDAVEVAGREVYELVFTGIGALCWLPDVRRWAEVVAGLLAPGGRLFLREVHPVLWALADPPVEGRLTLELPYFEQLEPLVVDEGATYVETDVQLGNTVTHEWNHGLGQTVAALLDAGLRLTGLVEHDSVPRGALPGLMTLSPDGEYRLIERPERLPCSYTLQAVKPAD